MSFSHYDVSHVSQHYVQPKSSCVLYYTTLSLVSSNLGSTVINVSVGSVFTLVLVMYQPISLKVGTYWDLYKTNPYSDFKIKVYKDLYKKIGS